MKKCFVIGPFGEAGSSTRKRSDFVFKNFIKRAAQDTGHEAYRSIDRGLPGDIGENVIRELYNADLVIADLTDSNPNVFYELALRHSMGKPLIHISETTKNIPFDVQMLNVIEIKLDFNIEQAEIALTELRDQIKAVEEGKFKPLPAARLRADQSVGLRIGVYTWVLEYSRGLAKDWLQLQTPVLQSRVKAYEEGGGAPEEPVLRRGLAEYLEYTIYQGTRSRGELYYMVESDRGDFRGWANFDVKGSAAPLAIPIYGREQKNGSITVNFDQPSRSVKIGDYDEVIKAFAYEITFALDPESRCLDGNLYHPDYRERELVVARTTLIPTAKKRSAAPR